MANALVDYGIIQPVRTQQPDIANTLLTVEAIKGARDRQTLNALAVRKAEAEESDRALLAEAGPAAVQGDKGAMARLAARPAAYAQIADAIDKMDARTKAKTKERVEATARVAAYADTPEKWDAGIDELVGLGYADLAKFKGQFSPERRQFALNQALTVKDILEGSKPIAVAEGSTLFDPRTKQPIYTNPKTEPPIFQDRPMPGEKVQRVVSYDKGRTFQPFGEQYDRREPFMIQEVRREDGTIDQVAIPRAALGAGASPAPSPGPQAPPAQGEPAAQPGGLPPGSRVLGSKPPTMTAEQSKDAGFADRMSASEAILANVAGEGASFWGRLKEDSPGGNYLQSEEYRSFEQARRDFINAQLRRESGAVISPAEFENADKQYFPRPGDDPKVMAQKAANRKTAIEAMKRSSGPAYKPPASTRPAGLPQDAKQAPDGKWYSPDPTRPGKYLLWQ